MCHTGNMSWLRNVLMFNFFCNRTDIRCSKNYILKTNHGHNSRHAHESLYVGTKLLGQCFYADEHVTF